MSTLCGFPIRFTDTHAAPEPPARFGDLSYYRHKVYLSGLSGLRALLSEAPTTELRASRATIDTLRKARTEDGEYLWQAGVQAGERDRFHGVPIVEDATLEPGAFQFRDREGRLVTSGTVSLKAGS